MTSFSINVRSEKDDKRIPIAVASDIMFDIQLLLTHIGESFISEEFGLYSRPADPLTGRFTLYIDPDSGGMSFRTSAGSGQSVLMDKAMKMLLSTLEKMGSGSGTYWMEDSFKDPCYRSVILYDLMRLSEHMAAERGYTLMFGSESAGTKFTPLDIEKAGSFLDKNSRSAQGSVVGLLNSVMTKRNIPLYGFAVGDSRVKISFHHGTESAASQYVDLPVTVKGTLRYSDQGELLEVSDINSIGLFDKKTFMHMISAERDVPLTKPLEAAVAYDNITSTWKIGYPDLGISISNHDWDAAVSGFHDYFVFLFDNYSSKDDNELSEEEREVKASLNSLTMKAE
ncbi:MAG: hypothetical protein FWD37_06530 [Methanomassiliicoccaceae archaeon]|nr:hypothetical protein [Methanomassiliicoccaceae archaeon]